MSETEYFTGKLQQIYTDLPLEEACEKLAKEHNLVKTQRQESYEEVISDYFYKSCYTVVDDKLYKILEINEVDDDDDIFMATANSDDTISFTVRYYNGGCGFSEALEYALEKLDD